mmetsp:Transcript_31612/g.66054  ORF Transcript_31612/g.66054 Transcript_31612/m.66054 type:complete len:757 (-) Transcript_31612:80-2350(-)
MTPSSPLHRNKLRRLRSPDESSSMNENRRLDRDSPNGNSFDETNFENVFGDDNGAVPIQSQIINRGHNLPPNPTETSSSQDPSPLDEAPWSTRATILFAQGIVLTSIVGTVIFFCLRRHVKRSRRFAAQRAHARREWMEWMEAMQQRTTIRISSSAADDVDGLGRVGNGNSVGGDDLEAVMNMIEEGLRSNSNNSLAQLQQQLQQLPQQQQQPQPQQQQQPALSSEDPNNVGNNSPSPMHTLLLVPRTILSVLTAPLRALDDAVNSWSTERGGYDAQYFQSVMDRIQREKEERMENPKEREVRLKEAFMKGRMVWELEDDCFVGPECGIGRRETVKEEFTVRRDVHEKVVASESGRDCRVVGDYENESCDGLMGDEQQNDLFNEQVKDRNDNAGVQPQDLSRTNATSVTADDKNATSSTTNEPATNVRKAVSVEEESKQLEICNQAECSETGNSNAFEVRNNVETVDELHKGEESNECPQVTETVTQNESPMAPRDNGESNEFIYLAVPNRPRNRTVSEPCAQDILELAQSSSASASARFPDDDLRLSQVEQDDDFSSTQPIRRPIPNQCAICLCDYEPGDTIVVSASSSLRGNNDDGTSVNQRGNHCPHAFHQECIVEWLVKMQDGTPCPCCRQTFVELDDHIPNGNHERRGRATVTRASTNASTVSETSTLQGMDEAERARQERRRRHIELGIQRGGRAFNISAISFGTRANAPLTPQELEESARIRQERRRRHIELGIQRGGRAFDFSRISMR